MNITLTQLQYIVAVDTYGSFSKAAEKCFVTQPTLSMQIQKLEDIIQVEIFDRKKKPIKATDLGAEIIAQARVTLREGKKIEDILALQKGTLEGELKIGIIPTISPYLLPKFIQEYRKNHPKVKLIVKEMQTEDIIGALKNDLLDLGILALPLKVDGLVEKPIYYESFKVYLSPKHPLLKEKEIKPEDLDIDEVLLLDDGHCFRDQALQICRSRPMEGNEVSFQSGNLETLKYLTDRSMGITLLPELMVENFSANDRKRLRNFKGASPKREVGLIFGKAYLKKNLINDLAKEIKKSLENDLLKKSGKIVPINP